MNTVAVGWPLGVLLFLLVAAAAVVTRLAELGRPKDVLFAAARGVSQLAVVSLVIGFVLRSLWLTFGFLLVMVTVAAATSSRRITGGLRPRSWWTAVPICRRAGPDAGGNSAQHRSAPGTHRNSADGRHLDRRGDDGDLTGGSAVHRRTHRPTRFV